MKSPEFPSNVNIEPSVDVRLLTESDAESYVNSVRDEANRLGDVKHKLFLGNLYRNKQDLLDRLEAGEERMGIFVDGILAGGADTLDTGKENEQELSYWLRKEFTRKGIGRLAVAQVAKVKNDQGINLKAVVEPENYSSANLLDQNGFRELGTNQSGQYVYGRSVRNSVKVDEASRHLKHAS